MYDRRGTFDAACVCIIRRTRSMGAVAVRASACAVKIDAAWDAHDSVAFFEIPGERIDSISSCRSTSSIISLKTPAADSRSSGSGFDMLCCRLCFFVGCHNYCEGSGMLRSPMRCGLSILVLFTYYCTDTRYETYLWHTRSSTSTRTKTTTVVVQ